MIKIGNAADYDMGEGFVFELRRHWNFDDAETWAIPAWEEMGLADLDGKFPTRASARRAARKCGIELTA